MYKCSCAEHRSTRSVCRSSAAAALSFFGDKSGGCERGSVRFISVPDFLSNPLVDLCPRPLCHCSYGKLLGHELHKAV
jgi:hypothetical protein